MFFDDSRFINQKHGVIPTQLFLTTQIQDANQW